MRSSVVNSFSVASFDHLSLILLSSFLTLNLTLGHAHCFCVVYDEGYWLTLLPCILFSYVLMPLQKTL